MVGTPGQAMGEEIGSETWQKAEQREKGGTQSLEVEARIVEQKAHLDRILASGRAESSPCQH
jgi:hypothetical protein